MVTGIDDHSRFVVITAVMAVPAGRAVGAAATPALPATRYVRGKGAHPA